jgi:hypothetical protein
MMYLKAYVIKKNRIKSKISYTKVVWWFPGLLKI